MYRSIGEASDSAKIGAIKWGKICYQNRAKYALNHDGLCAIMQENIPGNLKFGEMDVFFFPSQIVSNLF